MTHSSHNHISELFVQIVPPFEISLWNKQKYSKVAQRVCAKCVCELCFFGCFSFGGGGEGAAFPWMTIVRFWCAMYYWLVSCMNALCENATRVKPRWQNSFLTMKIAVKLSVTRLSLLRRKSRQEFRHRKFKGLVSHHSAISDTISFDAPYSAKGFRGKLFLRYLPF